MATDTKNPCEYPEYAKLCNIEHAAQECLTNAQTALERANTCITTDPENYVQSAECNLANISACCIPKTVINPQIADMVTKPYTEYALQQPNNPLNPLTI